MARIRTIKPEFFTHPVYARLADSEQILAVALLTHSDDFGFFRADPEIVRGACRPYWDSGKIRETLRRLSEVGWWTLRHHPEQGALGHITTWDKHQRISHKTPSKIRKYWDKAISGNAPELLRLEQGTGNREQGGGEAATPAAAPTPPVTKNENRQMLARHLRRLGLSATREAITEWGELLTFRGGCHSVETALEALTWIVGQQPTIKYARQAGDLAQAWSQLPRKARRAPDPGRPATISPAEGSEYPPTPIGPP